MAKCLTFAGEPIRNTKDMDIFIGNLAHFSHGMLFCFFLLVSLDLYRQKDKSRLLRFLFGEMVFWVFIELKDLIYLYEPWWSDPYVSTINLSVDMWTIPGTMLFLFEVLSPGWVSVKRVVLMMSPSMLFTFLFVIIKDIRIFHLEIIYSLVLGTFSLLLVLSGSRRYDRFIMRNFSYVENMRVTWMRVFISLLYVVLIVWTVSNLYTSWLGDVVFYLSAFVLWIFIYKNSMKHQVVDIPNMLNPFVKYEEEDLSDPDRKAEEAGTFKSEPLFAERLVRCMEQGKLYLNPRLTIIDVSVSIGTNRTYLSNYINGVLNTTFYEYVNAFRVREASVLLVEQPTSPLKEVAEQCGFNSLSTFRRSFEKAMNLTPAEYRAKVLKSPPHTDKNR